MTQSANTWLDHVSFVQMLPLSVRVGVHGSSSTLQLNQIVIDSLAVLRTS
jgi:hypothetical protein